LAIPDADPEPAIAIQLAEVEVVQEHPDDVVIVRLPLPPLDVGLIEAGVTV
jgi:hypothetical protein